MQCLYESGLYLRKYDNIIIFQYVSKVGGGRDGGLGEEGGGEGGIGGRGREEGGQMSILRPRSPICPKFRNPVYTYT